MPQREQPLIPQNSPLLAIGQVFGIDFHVPVSAKKDGYWAYTIGLTAEQRAALHERGIPCYNLKDEPTEIMILFNNSTPLSLVSIGVSWQQMSEEFKEKFAQEAIRRGEQALLLRITAGEPFLKLFHAFPLGNFETEIHEIPVVNWLSTNHRSIGIIGKPLHRDVVLEDGSHIVHFWNIYRPEPVSSILFRQAIKPKKESKVLVLGSGTGVDALFAAQKGAGTVIASDIDPLAVACTRYNVEHSGYKQKITTIQGDLFNLPGRPAEERFDSIYFNMPLSDTIEPEGKSDDMNELSVFDKDMDLLTRLLDEADSHLEKNGTLVVSYAEDPQFLELVYKKGWEPVKIDGTNLSNIFLTDTSAGRPPVQLADYAVFALVKQKNYKERNKQINELANSYEILAGISKIIHESAESGLTTAYILDLIRAINLIYTHYKDIEGFNEQLIAKVSYTIMYALGSIIKDYYKDLLMTAGIPQRNIENVFSPILTYMASIFTHGERYPLEEPRRNELYPEFFKPEDITGIDVPPFTIRPADHDRNTLEIRFAV